MMRDKIAAKMEEPAKFIQIPVRPRGHNREIRSTGNTSEMDREIIEAGMGFSIASI